MCFKKCEKLTSLGFMFLRAFIGVISLLSGWSKQQNKIIGKK